MAQKKYPQKLGAHLSIAGGVHTVFERAAQVDARAVQIFTKSNKSYFAKALTQEQVDLFTATWEQSAVTDVVTHAAYLINLGASNPEVEKKSCASLIAEIERCQQLGIAYLVLHPGAHTGAGVEACIAQIAKNLSEVLQKTANATFETTVLLETAAGQGTTVGVTFEELRAIYDACDASVQNRVGVCLDTCHIFAAGYNLQTHDDYRTLWDDFDRIIGREKLKVIHLNDSKLGCGSRRDRHENLGKGEIALAVLKQFACDESLHDVIITLETPSVDGITEYQEELKILRDAQSAV